MARRKNVPMTLEEFQAQIQAKLKANDTELNHETLGAKMEKSRFHSAKEALYSKIQRDMLNSPTPELHEKLSELNPRTYAELEDVEWLFNRGNWRSEEEMNCLYNAVLYKAANPKHDSKIEDKKNGAALRNTLAIGAFLGMTIFFLIFSWANHQMFHSDNDAWGIVSAIYMIFPTILPAIGIALFSSAVLGCWFFTPRITKFLCKDKEPIAADVSAIESRGCNLKAGSVKNILMPFLGITPECVKGAKPDGEIKSSGEYVALAFLALFLSFLLWMSTGPIGEFTKNMPRY